jgi:hypothetical protein
MKIKLTESQIERLKSISEGVDNKYNREVFVKFYADKGVNFKGMEIDDIEPVKMRLYYDIDIESRSWGIKSILLYNITGPDEVETDFTYYTNENGDSETEYLKIKLDWEKALNVETESASEAVTVGYDVECYIGGSVETGFFATKISVTVYGL